MLCKTLVILLTQLFVTEYKEVGRQRTYINVDKMRTLVHELNIKSAIHNRSTEYPVKESVIDLGNLGMRMISSNVVPRILTV